jgi:hypothetical protein
MERHLLGATIADSLDEERLHQILYGLGGIGSLSRIVPSHPQEAESGANMQTQQMVGISRLISYEEATTIQ